MIVFKENQLTEGADIQAIQKKVVAAIVTFAAKDSSYKAQKSSPQKVFIGEALGALRGVAEALNPMADHYPVNGNRQLQNDAVAVYKKILQNISDLEKIYTKDYGDDLW
jgi:hypothetical protein